MHEEYLRRNIIYARACAANAAAEVALARLQSLKQPAPKWLVANLNSILQRMPAVIEAARDYRDDAPDAPAAHGKG